MTEQQTYTDTDGDTIEIGPTFNGAPGLLVHNIARLGGEDVAVHIDTARLLAMIDALDPAAMRDYLRETVLYAELLAISPETPGVERVTNLVDSAVRGFNGPVTDPRLPGVIAEGIVAQLAVERFEAIPEADSPEDTDERVPPREALLTDAQERRLYLIEQLTKTLPVDESVALAHWIITGGIDPTEDLTLSGEEIGR